MSDLKAELSRLRKICEEAHPLPWGPAPANSPFYAIVKKPRPSLSKHDTQNDNLWHVDDANCMLTAVNKLPALIEALECAVAALKQYAGEWDHDGCWVSNERGGLSTIEAEVAREALTKIEKLMLGDKND